MCEGGRAAASMARTASASRRQPETTSLAVDEAGGRASRRPRGWKAVGFMIGLYLAIAMALNAFAQPVTNYLIKRYNMKPNAATSVANVFSGTYSFSPVVGAFVADAFCGRFWTLLFGAVAAFVAMVVITLSATIRQLKPPSCSDVARQAGTCAGPSGLHRAVLYIGMALLVVATGGANPTSLPFGADQFDHDDASSGSSSNEADERRRRAEEPAGLKRFYNWYYVVTMMASFMALTFIAYIQDKVSWGLGFGIPTALVAATFAVFLAGTPLYVRVPAEGSIFSSVARVVVASCRKRRLTLPHPRDARQQEAVLYNPPVVVAAGTGTSRVFKLPLTLQLSFLNKAAIVTADADEIRPDGSPARPWSLCSVQQVEEVKCLVKIVPVWISGVMWFISVAELTNYTFLQALTMDLHMGRSFTIPPVSIAAIFNLAIVLFVPVYDLLVARAAQRVTGVEGGITVLQRQGVGVAISGLALVVAAVVERRRRASALDNGGTSPMSVFVLAPQLAVMGVSAAFNMIGQMEFYNTEFPDQMRTLANAAFYCAQGASSYLATAVVNVVNARTRRRGGGQGWVAEDINAGKLDHFYYAMAVFAAINFVYFLVCSYFYRYKGEPEVAAEDSPPATPEAVLLKH
ncbi:protein NRT1/ PTR FAMILY 2.13-like [Oryza glaberrima]|uniref:Major facilitator superfamily (MFS) profile domain-containing protein n=2 Tax=Oryza TaxID=4527 RepID=A0A0D3G179_9ORYZ|nr:protein NRT1/ PTR FAMILY 2.13-like [Oryza glaberrima]